jgi:TonB-dependent SusC/RagA subfamily outer membrane receptor
MNGIRIPVASFALLAAVGMMSACAAGGVGSGGIPVAQRSGGGGLCAPPNGLSSEDIQAANVSHIEQALGMIPGVNVRWVGSGYSVQIRGISSFSANTEPLYVIDGMVVSGTRAASLPVQPHDIECIEVLKDATHTAMFGSRGANGVILITTRRGH